MRIIGKICVAIGGILLIVCLINFVFLKDNWFLPGDFIFYVPFIVVDLGVGVALLKMASETDDGSGGGFGGGGGFRIGKRRSRY